jgi:pyruvate/2-oxoglutarate dehydrogenase complex dihydrolipoamide dehydrogenase (E3) component
MLERIKADICVIGAGSGGLSVAAGAAMLGQKVVLIEKHKMGGDCLNYGCVPSKALIAAAKRAHAMRSSAVFGVGATEPYVDFKRVHDHIHEVIAAIAPIDSVERFEGLGCRVILGQARFISPTEVEANGIAVRARRFVVATGSRAGVPPIQGLAETPYFTNETLFENTTRPEHLIVIGGGPIGLEMAQAHRRLGSRVTVLEANRVLPKDDPELVEIVARALRADGVDIREGVKIERVERSSGGVSVQLNGDRVSGSHILLAAGRAPVVDGLDLEKGGIEYTKKGITVDHGLRSTTNRRVYAVGDIAGSLQFTHMANYHAGLVIRSALFHMPVRTSIDAIPWCTYTDPELAHVGMTEEAARSAGKLSRVLHWNLAENDRAQAERQLEGAVKVVVGKAGRVLGATIAAPHAGDLIQPWVLALSAKLKIGAMQGIVAAYPTLGEINKRVAGTYFTPTLFSPRVRAVVKLLKAFG